MPWLIYILNVSAILHKHRKAKEDKGRPIERIGLVNYWELPFDTIKLIEDYNGRGWIETMGKVKRLLTFQTPDIINGPKTKFYFDDSHWCRFTKGLMVTRLGADAIFYSCPSSMAFYCGMIVYVMKEDVVMTTCSEHVLFSRGFI